MASTCTRVCVRGNGVRVVPERVLVSFGPYFSVCLFEGFTTTPHLPSLLLSAAHLLLGAERQLRHGAELEALRALVHVFQRRADLHHLHPRELLQFVHVLLQDLRAGKNRTI